MAASSPSPAISLLPLLRQIHTFRALPKTLHRLTFPELMPQPIAEAVRLLDDHPDLPPLFSELRTAYQMVYHKSTTRLFALLYEGSVSLFSIPKRGEALILLGDYPLMGEETIFNRGDHLECETLEKIFGTSPLFTGRKKVQIEECTPFAALEYWIAPHLERDGSSWGVPLESESFLSRAFELAYSSGNAVEQIILLEKLSRIYLENRNYKTAAHLLNGALALSESPRHQRVLIKRLEEIERGFVSNRLGRELLSTQSGSLLSHRQALQALRAEARGLLDERRPIEEVQTFLTKGYSSLLNALIDESNALIREALDGCDDFLIMTFENDSTGLIEGMPDSFAVMGLGSMARREISPYSDLEFAFLIRDPSPENLSYCRLLDQLLTLKMINMGETKFPLIRSEDRSLVPIGFSMDIGGISPSGKPGIYELIGTPHQLAQFQTEEWLSHNGSEIILANAMTRVTCLIGDPELVAAYEREVADILNAAASSPLSSPLTLQQKRALELIRGHLEEFQPRLDQNKIDLRAFDVKKELYRPLQMIIGGLALYHGLRSPNTFEQIDELQEKGILNGEGANRLKKVLRSVFHLRIESHLFYQTEKEVLYHARNSIEGESGEKLLEISAKMGEEITEIYRTLVPLHRMAERFLIEKSPDLFSNAVFYDESVGRYKSQEGELPQLQSAEAAVALDPNSCSARYNLGEIQTEIGRSQEAIENLREALCLADIEPIDRANILKVLGLAYLDLEEPHQAIEQFNASLEIHRQLPRGNPLHIALLYSHLGEGYRQIGQHNESIEMLTSSLRLFENGSGSQSDPDFADLLRRIGAYYYELGDYQQAIGFSTSAVERLKAIYEDRPSLKSAFALELLGAVHRKLGDPRQAADHSNAALAIYRLFYEGRPHLNSAKALYSLGLAYQAVGELNRAVDSFDSSLEIYQAIYKGCPHSRTAKTMVRLSYCYLDLNQLERAIAIANKSLVITRQLHRDQPHIDAIMALLALGIAYLGLNRLDRSIEELTYSLAMGRELYNGRPNRAVARVLSTLGAAHAKKEEPIKAVGFYRSSLAIYQELEEIPSIANHLLQLGSLHNDLEEYQQALDHLLPLKSYLKGDSNLTKVLFELGRAYNGLRGYGAAVECLVPALEKNRQIHGARPHLDLARNLYYLGYAYSNLKEYRQATDCYEPSLAIYRQLQGYYSSHPDVATILSSLGGAYKNLNDPSKAITYFDASLAMQKRLYGNHAHSGVAVVLSGLGDSYRALSNHRRAAEHYELSLAMQKKLHGDRAHPDVANILSHLGGVYSSVGDHPRAIESYKGSLAMQREIHATLPHLDVANTLSRLGAVYRSVGDYPQAIEYEELSLAVHREIHGSFPHLDVANTLSRLGDLYSRLGDYSRATESYQAALAMLKEIYNEQPHPDPAANLTNLGDLYSRLGDYSRATESYQTALAMLKEVYREQSHPDMATHLTSLGRVYSRLGDYSEAIKSYSASLTMLKETYSEEPHPAIAANLTSLGSAYNRLGDYLQAIEFYESSLEMLNKSYNDHPHPDIAANLMSLGDVYNSLDDYFKATESYQASLAMLKEIYSDRSHPDIATILMSLGDVYSHLGDYSGAIESYQTSLAMFKKIYSDRPHPDIAANLINLGRAYSSLGSYSEAVELYEAGLARLKQVYGERPHSKIIMSLINLSRAYAGLGDYSQANQYREASLEMQKEVQTGEPHFEVAIQLIDLGVLYDKLCSPYQAIESYEASLTMLKQVYGGQPHPYIAKNLSYLGSAYAKVKEFDRATHCLEGSLEICKTTRDSLSLATTWMNMGGVQYYIGNYFQAIEYSNLALTMWKQIYSDRPCSNTSISLMNLGIVWSKMGNHDEAIKCSSSSLEMNREIYSGRPHPNTALSLVCLGEVYREMIVPINLGSSETEIAQSDHGFGELEPLEETEEFPTAVEPFDEATSGFYGEAVHCFNAALFMYGQIQGDQVRSDVIIGLTALRDAYQSLGHDLDATQSEAILIEMCNQIYGYQPHHTMPDDPTETPPILLAKKEEPLTCTLL